MLESCLFVSSAIKHPCSPMQMEQSIIRADSNRDEQVLDREGSSWLEMLSLHAILRVNRRVKLSKIRLRHEETISLYPLLFPYERGKILRVQKILSPPAGLLHWWQGRLAVAPCRPRNNQRIPSRAMWSISFCLQWLSELPPAFPAPASKGAPAWANIPN